MPGADDSALRTVERNLLVVPMVAGLAFGLFPLLSPSGFAAISGFPGYDPYIYRLAGAATLGYGVGLAYGLRRGDWAGLRLPVAGTLTFKLFGFAVTDLFIYRQAGAATFGYATMGIMELRSRAWREMRVAILMAAVFNGVSCVASVVSLAQGDPFLLPGLVGIASLGVTICAVIALRTHGRDVRVSRHG